MSFVYLTPEMKRKEQEVIKYCARSAEENAGNGFIAGTPEYILEYDRELSEYYNGAAFDSNGDPIM